MTAITTSVSLRSQVIQLLKQLYSFPQHLVLLGNQECAFVGDRVADNSTRHQESITPQLYQALLSKVLNSGKTLVEGDVSGKYLGLKVFKRALWLLLVDELPDSLAEEAKCLYDFVEKFYQTTDNFGVVGKTTGDVTSGSERYYLVVEDEQCVDFDEGEEHFEPHPRENMSRFMFNILIHYPAGSFLTNKPGDWYKILRERDIWQALNDMPDISEEPAE